MYLRTVRPKGVEYVPLAHNRWKGGQSRPEILYSFGRKDQLDLEARSGTRSGKTSWPRPSGGWRDSET